MKLDAALFHHDAALLVLALGAWLDPMIDPEGVKLQSHKPTYFVFLSSLHSGLNEGAEGQAAGWFCEC